MQQSILRIKRAWDYFADGLGEILTEDGRALRPKDAKCREYFYGWRNGRPEQKPRTRLRRRAA